MTPSAPSAPAAVAPAVEVRDLVQRYGDVVAVAGVGATFRRGAVTAVLGPNGAGKTTLLETCEGFRPIGAGTVRVLGLDPRRDARALRPRVGVMLQVGGVWGGARAGEVVGHLSRLYAHPLAVPALLTRVGLDAHTRTPYRRMSGGEQQRVKLACALVGRPELVFLDEPTAGLDPHGRHLVWDLVRELRADGVSVVLCTHHMEEAEALADDVLIVDRGRVVAQGSPAELTSGDGAGLSFRGPAGLDLAALAAALPEGFPVAEDPAGTYQVHGDITPQVLATVTAWCAAHGVLPDGLRLGKRTLEDVFLDLTGRELAG